ncbi:MAG TPA: hypothetical protein VGZ69_07555 [Candidatus Rhabdochlamydia sp.]|jgi:hypothetical protein|nr:hypothetical protein [Candidatus Rhabdochlamydia sp.]
MNIREMKNLEQIQGICYLVAKGDYSHLKELKQMATQRGYSKAIKKLAISVYEMILKLHLHEHKLELIVKRLEAMRKELKTARNLLKEKNVLLQKKVHVLEINIDQIKKNAELDRIVQSEFFNKIKNKALHRRKTG